MKELLIDLNAYLNTCDLSRFHLLDLHTILKEIQRAPAAFSSQTVCKELILWAEKLEAESKEKTQLHEILHKNLPEIYFAAIDFFQVRHEFFTALEDLVRENKPDFIARNLFSDFINTLKKTHSSTVLICREIILWVEAFKNPDGFDFEEDLRWKDDVLNAVQQSATAAYTKARIWILITGYFGTPNCELKESADALSVSEFCNVIYKKLQDDVNVEASKVAQAVSAIDKDYSEMMLQVDENKGPLKDVCVLICELNHVLCTEPVFSQQHKELTKLLDHFAGHENLQSKSVFDELQRWAERAAEKSTQAVLKKTLQDFAFKVSISRILESRFDYVSDKVRENLLTEKSVKEGCALLSALPVTNSADITLLFAVNAHCKRWLRGKDKPSVRGFPIIWTPEKIKENLSQVLAPRNNGAKKFL